VTVTKAPKGARRATLPLTQVSGETLLGMDGGLMGWLQCWFTIFHPTQNMNIIMEDPRKSMENFKRRGIYQEIA
jgi:hypothetical protein